MTDDPAESSEPTPAVSPEDLSRMRGMDLVRRTLEEARGAARSQGKDVGRGRRAPVRRVAGNAGRDARVVHQRGTPGRPSASCW